MSGAITAVGVSIAAMTMAEVFTAVAITGAVVGAIGAVTHVKELQYAGMALGAVGGIGALAVSAGMFAAEGAALAGALGPEAGVWAGDIAGVSAMGAAGSGAGGAYTAAEALGMATGFEAAGIMPSAAGTPLFQDVINMATGGGIPLEAAGGVPLSTAEAAASPAVIPDVATDGYFAGQATAPNAGGQGDSILSMNGTEPPITGGHDGTDLIAQATPTTQPVAVPDPAAGVPTVVAPVEPVVAAPPTTGPTPLNPATFPSTSSIDRVLDPRLGTPAPSLWASIGEFMRQPGSGYLVGGGVQAIGSFLAGAMDPKNEALVRQANAQADLNIAAANLQRQQLQNMSGPMSVAHRVPRVTGAPAPTGLINTPPPRVAPVTGSPA